MGCATLPSDGVVCVPLIIPRIRNQELFNQLLLPRIDAEVIAVVDRYFNAEQLGLLIVRQLNPDVVFTQQDEAKLRGVGRKTLRGMKDRGEIARGLNADTVNSQSGSKLPKK